MLVKLREVTPPELLPPLGLVCIPAPQFRGRCNLLEPQIQRGLVPAQPARPQPIHENPDAVSLFGCFIDTFDLQFHGGMGGS